MHLFLTSLGFPSSSSIAYFCQTYLMVESYVRVKSYKEVGNTQDS